MRDKVGTKTTLAMGKTRSDTLTMKSKTDQPAPSLFLLQDSASEYLFSVGMGI